MLRVSAACVTLILLSNTALAANGESAAARGKLLVERLCGQCHATGISEASPHPAAPTFRRLGNRIDLDAIGDRLRQGLFSGHRDMPEFRLTREEARAVRIYLRNIQSR